MKTVTINGTDIKYTGTFTDIEVEGTHSWTSYFEIITQIMQKECYERKKV